MTHWSGKYVGRPWNASDAHCWEMVRLVYRLERGIQLPSAPVDAGNARRIRQALAARPQEMGWRQVVAPRAFDLVLMAKGRWPDHIGIWVGGGMNAVLHSIRGPGVVITRSARLAELGYRCLGFYRRMECAPIA